MTMKDGTRDLCRLLAAMEPRLLPDEFVFCTVADGREDAFAELPALATFREEEGLSVVLERSLAESHGFRYGPVMRCISLTVHSALDAVGLTAAISDRLARQGISANVVAAYFHDHVFVPAARAEEALKALRELQNRRK
ncbi:MAG: ACT domain-containing protein [Gammaproteobacteria bacterium]|nr:ACT domain-containing protein [Gammaproteobacteria bacterium]MDE0509227.1 ACT domain-containing protein [Gammaproteobacteria bacterium]